jgi:hypothetical protein
MPDDIPRNGSSAGYGADERAQALPARPAAVPAVPPMEAEWLRAVGGHPSVHGGSNGSGSNGSGSNGSGPNGADAPPAAGNGPSAGGVDSTRGGH